MSEREYYVLDRIEWDAQGKEGTAVLLSLPENTALLVSSGAVCADLPAGKSRPADGTVFFRDQAGNWHPDYDKTTERRQQLRERVQRLKNRKNPKKQPAAPAEPTAATGEEADE